MINPWTGSVAALVLAFATSSRAQNVEEIVVTATKREMNLRDVAGSVGAVSGEDLEQLGARDMEDFLKLVPGVSLNKQEDSRGTPSIRGISSDTRLVITQSTTGIYVDEIPFTDPYLPGATVDLHPFDLERVEVLKGPQGTLYGSSSLGGAIRYITQKPKLDLWEGKLVLTGTSIHEGSDDGSGAAALNVPLFRDDLAVRVVALKQDSPGYIDDLSPGKGIRDSNEKEQTQWRALARWQPTDWPLRATFTYLEQETDALEAAFADQRERLERRNTPGPSRSDTRVSLANLVAEYDLGSWVSLLSSTSRSEKELDWLTDGARTLGLSFQSEIQTPVLTLVEAETIAQEIRLSSPAGAWDPWQWMIGFWYLRHDQSFTLSIPTPLPPIEALDLYNQYTDSLGTERAVFGEIARTFFGKWTVTVGGRYYDTRLGTESATNGLLVLVSSQSPSANANFDVDESGVNPKVSVSWDPFDHFRVYALVSRGFRFGGVQVLPPPLVPDPGQEIPESYRSDTLWNYELGTRSEWLDRSLFLDLTLFYDKWNDLQIAQISNTGLFNFIDNVGSAHTKGVEVAIRVHPFTRGFLERTVLSSSFAYIDAVTDVPFESGSGTVPEGTRLPGTPKFQAANVLSYATEWGRWAPAMTFTHSHVGSSFNDLFGTVELGGYDTFDLGVHLAVLNLPLDIVPSFGFSLTNLTDVRGIAGAAADPSIGFEDIYFIRPRTAELSLSVTWS